MLVVGPARHTWAHMLASQPYLFLYSIILHTWYTTSPYPSSMPPRHYASPPRQRPSRPPLNTIPLACLQPTTPPQICHPCVTRAPPWPQSASMANIPAPLHPLKHFPHQLELLSHICASPDLLPTSSVCSPDRSSSPIGLRLALVVGC